MNSTRNRILEYGLSFPDTYQDAPFHDDNWQLVRYKGNKKAFLWVYEKDGFVNLNVKTEPEKAFFWRDVYSAVRPAYHQNKRHWITIVLDGSIPDKDVRLMIAESYDLVADSPTNNAAAACTSCIRSIGICMLPPPCRVSAKALYSLYLFSRFFTLIIRIESLS